jgi:hypothetical protein
MHLFRESTREAQNISELNGAPTLVELFQILKLMPHRWKCRGNRNYIRSSLSGHAYHHYCDAEQPMATVVPYPSVPLVTRKVRVRPPYGCVVFAKL